MPPTTAWPPRPARRPWPTARAATACTTFCRRPIPKSTINPKNLPNTCGKCHPGAGTRFAISQVHVAEGGAEPAALRWVRQFYLLVIPVTIGLMLLHNGGDWVRKLIRLRFACAGQRLARPRLSPATANSACCPSSACSTPCWRSRSSPWSGPASRSSIRTNGGRGRCC